MIYSSKRYTETLRSGTMMATTTRNPPYGDSLREYDRYTTIIDRLFGATERKQVEGIFDKNEIADFSTRLGLLRRSMRLQDISNSPEVLTPEQEYSDELEIFLDGTWRFLI
jgi:hypothetical protein